jgi:hypothetical protein
MEEKLIDFLLTLNSINTKLKAISKELDKLNSDFIDQDFEELFVAEQLKIITPKDYE